ncbi:hypothetical protein [Asaia sp. HN010]|uniref:hypothetical protein n=1 Tax=Asaia sp. HN010 TaxID=3081233 RepID=UPI003019F7D3
MSVFRYSRFAVASVLLGLASCSGGAPSKEEVKDFLVSQLVEQAASFPPLSQEKKAELTTALKKKTEIQGLECTATKGFKDVWDCTINVVAGNDPSVLQFRFHRDQNGKLAGQQKAE